MPGIENIAQAPSGIELSRATMTEVPFMKRMLHIAAVPESIPEEYRPSLEKLMPHAWFNRSS